MKQIINTLAIITLAINFTFAQSKTGTKPVKKVVTSKITKDPKTGKVVKTITTITTTDIVLDPGTQKTASKPAAKPITQKKVVATTTKKTSVVKKPATKPAVVVKKTSPKPNLEAPKAVVSTSPAENENSSIFTNPNDQSVQNNQKPVEEKPVVNTPYQKSPIATSQTSKTKTTQTAKKVYKEKNSSNSLYMGLRGGLNVANVDNVISTTVIPSPTDIGKLGFAGGVFINKSFGKVFSIQPELNYMQQGFSVTNGIDTEILNNQAVNLPILLKMAIGGENFKVFVNGGPYAGFLLKSEKKIDLFGQKVTNLVDFATDATKEISTNRVDYGVQAGAGLQFNIGGPKLEIEGRYNYGLADPMNYAGTKPSYIGQTGRNRTWGGTIGLMFPIGK